MVKMTQLHAEPSPKAMIDWLREEMDAGQVTAFVVVATNHDGDVLRQHWIQPNGCAAYALLGGLEVEKAALRERCFREPS